MDQLRNLIDQHSTWQELEVFINRIDAFADRDFSFALENAKALLETIAKEICDRKSVTLGSRPSINTLIKSAFGALGISRSDYVTQISSSLANIGQQMGDMRNKIGISSHGRTLEQVRDRNAQIDDLSRDILLNSTELVACFLIRSFETLELPKPQPTKLEYIACSDFNDFWDEAFGDFQMGDYSFTASEILFQVDRSAYSSEYRLYKADDE